MTLEVYQLFGIAAGMLAFSALPVYVRSILRGETKPSRVTWWILALPNTLIAASYFASGARDTIWIPVAYAVGFSVVAVLSLKYGEGKWTWVDRTCLFGALATIPVWWFSGSAELALFLNIAIDFMGLLPTMYKAYKRPWTEDKTAWTISTVASLLNIFAIEAWTLAIALYPLYVFITNAITVGFIAFPRKTESKL